MYTPNILLGGISVASLIIGFRFFKNPVARISLLYCWVNIILSTVHYTNIQERYILPSIPFLMLLTSLVVTEIISVLAEKVAPSKIGSLLLFVSLTAAGAISIHSIFRIPQTIYGAGSVTLKGPVFTQTDYQDVWFQENTDLWPKKFPQKSDNTPLSIINDIADTIDITKPYWVYGISGFFHRISLILCLRCAYNLTRTQQNLTINTRFSFGYSLSLYT